MMAIGEYRHLVTLTALGDPVPDGFGGITEPLTPLDPPTWYCAVEPASGRDMERYVAAALQSTATHIVRGPYHPGITTGTQITFEGRILQVQSVRNEQERDVYLMLVCAEGTNSGGA